MISFVNAKINLGLKIIRKRQDGYHDLETVFYPVGLFNGSPQNPEPFCDILEINENDGTEEKFFFSGNIIDCTLERNLVYKAARIFRDYESAKRKANDSEIEKFSNSGYSIFLEKHIPDGAGLGGGSADASFTLKTLNTLSGNIFSEQELMVIASKLGADCAFFILNRPAYAEGVGDILTPIELNLNGKYCVIAKPSLFISTKEAFFNISPGISSTSLPEIIIHPVTEWEERGLKNDFEDSLFPKHPVLRNIKQEFYRTGALYSAMSGSGSSVFGIFENREEALKAKFHLSNEFADLTHISLCKL